jgi:hypothetical protein
MKTSIVQILSGALIIVLIMVFVQFILPGYHNDILLDKDGNIVGRVMGLQVRNISLEVWMASYAILGLAVCVCGVIQLTFVLRKKTSPGLTIIQLSLGVLVIGSVIFFLIKAEPHYTLYARIMENGLGISIWQKDPAWIFHQILWKEAAFIPGLLTAGCMIFDFLRLNKAKRQAKKEVTHTTNN